MTLNVWTTSIGTDVGYMPDCGRRSPQHFSNRQSGGEAYSEDSDEEDGDYVTIDDMLDEAETRERNSRRLILPLATLA